MSFEIAKAGWMMRESGILKRWKKKYFVLSRDGVFKYFEDDRSPVAEDAMVVKKPNVLTFREGLNLVDTSVPSGYSRGGLFKVKCNDKSWTLCADSPDDMSAWKLSLEEANKLALNPPQRQTATAGRATVIESTTHASGAQTCTVYPPQTTHVYQGGQVYPAGTAGTHTVYVTGQPYGTVVQPVPATTQTIVVEAQPYYPSCGRVGCAATYPHNHMYDDWWW